MNKFRFCYLSLVAGLFFVFVLPTEAQEKIGSIEIIGNRTISDAKILAQVRSRAGEVFDAVAAEEDTKRIAQLEGVDYCYYNTTVLDEKVRLTFVLVEHNLIRKIDIQGNRKYKDKKLRKIAGIKIGNYIDPLLAESARTRILEHYHKKGFAFAKVDLDFKKVEEGRLHYTVAEGPRVKIKGVKFVGNRGIKTRALKRVIKVKKTKFLFLPRYFTEKTLAGETGRLQNVYYENGYLNVKINQKRQFNDAKNKVNIIYEIEEGPAYIVDKIIISGNTHFKTESLTKDLKLKQGQIYNGRKSDSDVETLLKFHRENGFIDAKVDKKITYVSADRINIEIEVAEGQRFRIGQINITGNQETQEKVIRHVLDEHNFRPGKWYNADIARGEPGGWLEKELRQTVLLESATITPGGQQIGQRDAEVSVVEGQTGSVMIGAGVASDSGIMGQLVFQQRNFDIKDKPKSFSEFITGKAFKGAGQNLRIALEPGTEWSQYSVSFTEPYLKDKPISMDVVGSSWDRIREDYDENRLKGYLGFERRMKEKWRRNVGLRIENVKLSDIDLDAPREIKDEKGDNALVGFKFGFSRDLTDDRFIPTEGRIYKAGYEQVAGDNTFGVLSGSYKRFRTIYVDLAERKTVLATKLQAATTIGNAPVFEKFYAGGSHTLRGFDYRGVSTRGRPTTAAGVPIPNGKKKDPIGSDWLILANAEVIMPLVSDNFAMLFFVDSGLIDSGGYRASIGTGIQILIPQWFGPVPMRFELAVPFMKDDEDETEVFSFSVGRLF